MRQFDRSLILAALATVMLLPAEAPQAATPAEAAHARPFRRERVEGTNLSRLILTERAAKRLDIQTAEIRPDANGEHVIPYAALVYDIAGVPWVYTNPAPLTFVRHRVTVTRINGATAHVKDGPPPGTRVVTVGVAELYGAEKGVGH